MAAAQPGQLRWIIIRGRFFGGLVERGKKMRRQHGRARSDPNAVEEIAAGDLALHSQLTVLWVAHQYLPEGSARQDVLKPRGGVPRGALFSSSLQCSHL